MATAPDWRGRGAGSAVLAAVFAYVAASGGGLLWCNARLGAVDFYKRAGLTTTGEPWEEPVIGPHIAMFANIRGADSPLVAQGN
jgi:GNAT superfamily N-acetyltransferase